MHFVAVLLLAVGLLAAGKSLARGELVVRPVLVLWGLLNIGGIFDHRRWALVSELVRLPVTAAALASKLPTGAWDSLARGGLLLLVVAFWLWLLCYRRQFDGGCRFRAECSGASLRLGRHGENARLRRGKRRDHYGTASLIPEGGKSVAMKNTKASSQSPSHDGLVLRPPAEELYREELEALLKADMDARPPGWKLSPRAVRNFICGSEKPKISRKFYGDDTLVERAGNRPGQQPRAAPGRRAGHGQIDALGAALRRHFRNFDQRHPGECRHHGRQHQVLVELRLAAARKDPVCGHWSPRRSTSASATGFWSDSRRSLAAHPKFRIRWSACFRKKS